MASEQIWISFDLELVYMDFLQVSILHIYERNISEMLLSLPILSIMVQNILIKMPDRFLSWFAWLSAKYYNLLELDKLCFFFFH